MKVVQLYRNFAKAGTFFLEKGFCLEIYFKMSDNLDVWLLHVQGN